MYADLQGARKHWRVEWKREELTRTRGKRKKTRETGKNLGLVLFAERVFAWCARVVTRSRRLNAAACRRRRAIVVVILAFHDGRGPRPSAHLDVTALIDWYVGSVLFPRLDLI